MKKVTRFSDDERRRLLALVHRLGSQARRGSHERDVFAPTEISPAGLTVAGGRGAELLNVAALKQPGARWELAVDAVSGVPRHVMRIVVTTQNLDSAGLQA